MAIKIRDSHSYHDENHDEMEFINKLFTQVWSKWIIDPRLDRYSWQTPGVGDNLTKRDCLTDESVVPLL